MYTAGATVTGLGLGPIHLGAGVGLRPSLLMVEKAKTTRGMKPHDPNIFSACMLSPCYVPYCGTKDGHVQISAKLTDVLCSDRMGQQHFTLDDMKFTAQQFPSLCHMGVCFSPIGLRCCSI